MFGELISWWLAVRGGGLLQGRKADKATRGLLRSWQNSMALKLIYQSSEVRFCPREASDIAFVVLEHNGSLNF